MNFSIPTKTLTKSVELLYGVAGGDGYISIGEWGIEAVNNGIKTTLFFGTGDEVEWTYVVAAKPFMELLKGKKIKTEDVDISIDSEHVTVKSGRSKTKLKVYRSSVMQAVTDVDDNDPRIPMRTAVFKKLLDRVSYAAAGNKDFERPGLRGVLIHAAPGQLISVATNGHRLARYAVDVDVSAAAAIGPIKLTIPNDAVSLISRFLNYEKPDGNLTFVPGDGRAMLQTDYGAITFTLIDGEFPDYKAIMPEIKNAVELDTVEMGHSLSRLLTIAGDTKKVSAAFSGDEVSLEAGNGDFTGIEVLEIDGIHDVVNCNFNGVYMADAIGQCECRIAFNTTGPIVLQGLIDTEYKAVVMPMSNRV